MTLKFKHVLDIDKVCGVCSSFFGVAEDDLLIVRRGHGNLPRKLAIYACRKWGGETNKNIAKKFKSNSLSVVSDIVNKIGKEMEKSSQLKQKVMALKEEVFINRQTNT